MPRPHSLPKRRGLAVAVQLALTFAAGLYAPRARSQQITCPANGVTVTAATETNGIAPCSITGALTVDSGGTLNNTGALRTNLSLSNDGFLSFVGSGTLTNSGTLNNNGLGELTIDYQGTLDNNSGGILNNNGAGIPGTDRGLTVRGTLRNNTGGILNNSGKFQIGGTTSATLGLFQTRTGDFSGTIENAGTLTNSSIMDLYFASKLDNNAGTLLNSSGAFLTLRNSARLNNNSGGTVNNDGSLRFLNYSGLRNNAGAVFNNAGTLELNNAAELYSFGTLNNNGTLTIRDRGELTSTNLVNSGSLVNHSNGAFPDPTQGGLNNRGTMSNAGSLVNYGKFVNVFGTFTNNWFLTNRGNLYNRANSTLNNNAYLENYAGATFDNAGDLNNNLGASFNNSGTLRNLNYNPARVFTNDGKFYNNAGGLLTNAGRLNNTGLLYNRSGYMGPGGTIDNSGTLDNSGLIRNDGALTNSGTLTSGALAYGPYGLSGGLVNGGTLTNTGTLTTLGVINSGTLSNSGTFTNNDTLKNYGQIDNLAGGTLNNAGNLFNFATLNNAGTLNNADGLSNYGALNNLAGGIVNNSSYLLNYSGATLTNGGTLNNTGYLVNFGGATLTNNGTLNNNFRFYNLAGATVANNGTLNNSYFLANAGTLTNAAGATLNNSGYLVNAAGATLNNAGTLYNSGGFANAGTITNTGTLTVAAGGQLVDNGTLVQNAGTLRVDGTLSQAAVTINGGTLSGSGAITAPVVNGGTLMPGAAGSPGTLTINGSLTQNSGAVLVINATPAQMSRVTVNGAASIAGTVQLVAGAGTYPTTPQTILSATGGVSGTFSGVTTTSAFLTPSLSYDPNTVFLSFYQTATLDSVAMTPNQRSVSTLLGAIQAGGGAGAEMQAVLNAISGMSAADARAAFDSVAGAGNTAAFHAQFDMTSGFVRTLASRMAGITGGAGSALSMERVQIASGNATVSDANLVYAQAPGRTGSSNWLGPERDGAWVVGYGNDGKTQGDANASGYRQNGAGVALGADHEIDARWRVGGALNLGKQRVRADAGAGSIDTNGVSLAAYARYTDGPFAIAGIAGLGRNDNQRTRTVTVGATSSVAKADYTSSQRFAYAEASYTIQMNSFRLEPLAAFGYTRVSSPGYTETGAGALNLMVDGQARNSAKSYLGARSVHKLSDAGLTLGARALWSHEFGNADSALSSAQLAGAPGAGSFQTTGVALKRDGALLGVGLSGELRRNLSLFGDLALETRSRQSNASIVFGARYTW